MSARARGLAVALYTALSVVFFVLLQLPVLIVTGSGDFSVWLAWRFWSPSALWLAGIRRQIVRPPPPPEGPMIYASNHESALDIWLLLGAIRRNKLRFVAKQELFRIPVFGWYLRAAGYVPVDRRNHAQAVASLHRAGATVREGTSIIAFPEGTRSADGRIQPFKKGPFALALEANVPVVPVAIAGAAALNPKGRLEVSPGTVRIAFGDPVLPREYPGKDALLREVRARIVALHRGMGGAGADDGDAVAARGVEGRA